MSQPAPASWQLDRCQGVAINDAFVAAMPILECGEPMVDLREQRFGLRLDGRHMDEQGLAAWVRHGLAERLVAAQDLLPPSVRLLVLEAYRPPSLQAAYFQEHLEEVQLANPEWSLERCESVAALHVSPPHVAPHGAGGAVDVTLCRADGQELEMGTAVNATPQESDNRCFTAHPGVTGEDRVQRDTLSAVLAATGLVNYGPEWWHWSYGDQYWALRVGAPTAIYGPVASPAQG